MYIRTTAALLASALGLCTAEAYEIYTHARITQHTIERSELLSGTDSDLMERLGLDRLPTDRPFRLPTSDLPPDLPLDGYWEQPVASQASTVREPHAYERQMICPILTGTSSERWETECVADSGPTSGPDELSLAGWILRGSIREDDLLFANYRDGELKPDVDTALEEPFTRVFGHFYDPFLERPLEPYGLSCTAARPWPGVVWPLGACEPSPNWALGYEDALENPPRVDLRGRAERNFYSMAAAYEYLESAVLGLSPDPAEWEHDSYRRLYRWASTFKSLGHMVHLVQDAAQPQHTRNDPHSPVNSVARRATESYTEARALGEQRFTGAEAREFVDFYGTEVTFPDLRLDTPTPYPVPRFARSASYFTTRRRDGSSAAVGMADYSNRGFFTDGTLPPGNDPYPSPPGFDDTTFEEVEVVRPVGVGDLRWDVVFTEALRRVPDPLSPQQQENLPEAYAEFGGKIPLATRGLLSVQSETQVPASTISLENLTTHVDFLLPRAAAYGAGLIDYFFRGKLEVEAPEDGIIALADQGDPHDRNGLGYPQRAEGSSAETFGFRTARLRVRNVTEEIDDRGAHPQEMSSGLLWAVARYHRNPCYVPEMDTEWTNVFDVGNTVPNTGLGCGGPEDLRTGFQDIAVSRPVSVGEGDLEGDEGMLVEFLFEPSWIPISATDLFLQVIYEGTLGGEPKQVGLGMLDVSEPFHFLALNMTDYYQFNGSFERPEELRDEPALEGIDIDPDTLSIEIAIDGTPVLSAEEVEFGRFIRLGVLADAGLHDFSVTAEFERTGSSESFVGVVDFTTERQADTEYGPFGPNQPTPFLAIRGAPFNAAVWFFKFFGFTGDIPWDLDPLPTLEPTDGELGEYRRAELVDLPEGTSGEFVASELAIGSY